ncbi:MAG: tyrosine-type recombinase/integrase [Trueperaceae bacterium]
MNELEKYLGQPGLQARSWAALSEEDLRRRAMIAANTRDTQELWELTKAFVFLHGRKGGKGSEDSLEVYQRNIVELIEAWQGENLLRPSRDAGVMYVRDLESLPSAVTGKPLTYSTVKVKIASGRTLYKALRWAKATEANPFADVSPAPDPTPDWEKRKPYSTEDIDKLLEHADPVLSVMVLLGGHAGFRISEMCQLEWSDINWARASINVVGKGNKKASVIMSERLEAALLELRKHADTRKRFKRSKQHVLPWNSDHARRYFRKLCATAGVVYDEKAVHGLRHGAGTRYYAQTKDLGRVAAHLRHENIQTTRVYAKLSEVAAKEDLRGW